MTSPVVAVVMATHGQQDQLLRILYGQQAQQDLIEQSEDGCIRADAESERQDRDVGKTGTLPERAQGIAKSGTKS